MRSFRIHSVCKKGETTDQSEQKDRDGEGVIFSIQNIDIKFLKIPRSSSFVTIVGGAPVTRSGRGKIAGNLPWCGLFLKIDSQTCFWDTRNYEPGTRFFLLVVVVSSTCLCPAFCAVGLCTRRTAEVPKTKFFQDFFRSRKKHLPWIFFSLSLSCTHQPKPFENRGASKDAFPPPCRKSVPRTLSLPVTQKWPMTSPNFPRLETQQTPTIPCPRQRANMAS